MPSSYPRESVLRLLPPIRGAHGPSPASPYPTIFLRRNRAHRRLRWLARPGRPLLEVLAVNPHSLDELVIFGRSGCASRLNSAFCGGLTGAAMADPTSEADRGALRLDFDPRLLLQFRGCRITSDAGLLTYQELGDTLSLTDTEADTLADARSRQRRPPPAPRARV